MLYASLATCTIRVDGKSATTLTTVSSNYQTSHSSTTVQSLTACKWYRQVYVNFSIEHLHIFLLSSGHTGCCTIYSVVLFHSAFQAHFWKYFTLHFLIHTKQHVTKNTAIDTKFGIWFATILHYYTITVSIVKN